MEHFILLFLLSCFRFVLCLSVCLSVCLCVCMSLCLSVGLFACLSVQLSVSHTHALLVLALYSVVSSFLFWKCSLSLYVCIFVSQTSALVVGFSFLFCCFLFLVFDICPVCLSVCLSVCLPHTLMVLVLYFVVSYFLFSMFALSLSVCLSVCLSHYFDKHDCTRNTPWVIHLDITMFFKYQDCSQE